nr:MAG TPA: hypothetical protein [Caudoviricetes sp.]
MHVLFLCKNGGIEQVRACLFHLIPTLFILASATARLEP